MDECGVTGENPQLQEEDMLTSQIVFSIARETNPQAFFFFFADGA